MHVLLQLKLSGPLAVSIKELYEAVNRLHHKELEAFDRKLKTNLGAGLNIEKLNKERDELLARGKKLSVTNVVRALIAGGVDTKEDKVLELIDTNGSARGRPRGS